MTEPTLTTADALSPEVAQEVALRAGHLAAAHVPLAEGLRAAAQEADTRRFARALSAVAAALERGEPLEEVLAGVRGLPPHLAGLIRAAQRAGDLGSTLAEWIENRRSVRAHWRRVISELAYPAFSVLLACGVFLFFALVIIPPFRRMFEEMGLKLPANTLAMFWLCDAGGRIMLGVLGAGAVGLIGVRLIGGRSGWSVLMSNVPLLGPAWHWTGVAEMLRSLSLLVEQRVPLPDALRLSADGILDGHVAEQCRALATSIEQGSSFTMALVRLRSLPLSIVPLVHWGERSNSLAEALRSAARMLEDRLKVRTGMLAQVIPPIILVFVGGMAVAMAMALFAPMFSLIQGLT